MSYGVIVRKQLTKSSFYFILAGGGSKICKP